MSEIEISPTRLSKVAWTSMEFALAAFLFFLSEPWHRDVQSGQTLMVLLISAVLFAAAIEFPWKKVVISEVAIRDRRWFHWREFIVPPRVIVGRDSRGRVAIADENGRVVFRFVREFGKPDHVQRRVADFFDRCGRLLPQRSS